MNTDAKQRPIVQALILAEEFHVDPKTGRESIAGIIARQRAPTFPARIGRDPVAFLSLTNVLAPSHLGLRFRPLDSGSPIWSADVNAPAWTSTSLPTETISLALKVGSLPVPRPGVYVLEVVWNEETIGYTRVTVSGPTSP